MYGNNLCIVCFKKENLLQNGLANSEMQWGRMGSRGAGVVVTVGKSQYPEPQFLT